MPDNARERYAESPDVMPPSFPPQSREAAVEERVKGDQREDAPEEPKKKPRFFGLVLEFLTVISVALLISVILKTFFIQAFEIPSESMEDTFVPGDRIVVNKLANDADDLNRGDIVVFLDPGDWLANVPAPDRPAWQDAIQTIGEAIGLLPQNVGDHLVKRIIGLPGDNVACCNGEGLLTINGEPITETYIKPGVNPSDIEFDFTVPRGHVWVMGDNRSNSQDSRYHQIVDGSGFVPIKNIEGRAWLRILPFDRFGTLPGESDVFKNVPEPAQ